MGVGEHRYQQRRYDLDWLRIIAFSLLILYHIGLAYAEWGYHVQSRHTSTDNQWALALLNPWRLTLLFFISGIAFRYASDKLDIGYIARRRVMVLLPPIVFGIVVIVAPQSYFQLRQAGAIGSDFRDFYQNYIVIDQGFGFTTPTWNHLWYIVYLLVYSLILLPLIWIMRSQAMNDRIDRVFHLLRHPLALFFLPAIPFCIFTLTLDPVFPTTMDLTYDWAHHAHRFTIFLFGFLIAKNAAFWEGVERSLKWFVPLWGLIFLGGFIRVAVPGSWLANLPDEVLPYIGAIKNFYAWVSIVLLLSLAMRFLNRDSAIRKYMNDAVFSWYVIHQTILIAAVYYLTQYDLAGWVEFGLVVTITVIGCALFYEIGKRLPFGLGLLIGIPKKN